MKSAEIRDSFVDFFKSHGHTHQPSSPVIPQDDPTLLFVNAGMNQFKDVFTGRRKVSFPRAVTAQKCIRAGGKHNDLEAVGNSHRHHTFFEMLGNFSFGDYFKEEAITFAWEWVTKILKLSPDKLFATVYETDDDAFFLWEKIAPELKNGRILRFGKKDNYWSMGEVGPCGPCSEIHIDRGEHLSANDPDAWINTENERFVEIWNLVFMQYDQESDGSLNNLPKPSVDTGAGLERITAVMQGKDWTYDTDLFVPLIENIVEITGKKYDPGPGGVSHRVLADHVRALAFAIADGGGLSNEGRGYVLRRILRRAARHGRLLEHHEPLLYQLIPTLVDIMGGFYTELKEKQKHIGAVIKTEEERFGETLDTGLELFASLEKKVKASGSDTIPGEDIFRLYDTYGFPVDMTALMAEEAGLGLDMQGFDNAMARQQETSRAGAKFEDITGSLFKNLVESNPDLELFSQETEFVRGKESPVCETSAKILYAVTGPPPYDMGIILDRTPFYAESGGQVSDIGTVENENVGLQVKYLLEHKGLVIHMGEIKKGASDVKAWIGQQVTAVIDEKRRRDIMRNHTATHLLHAALRRVVGEHVKQAGSLVAPDRLRFDFAHYQALTPEQVERIEEIVNEEILRGTPVTTAVMDTEAAMKLGAMALFGEKYGEKVRVVSVEGFSKELCGGTHVRNTAEIGSFLVTDESAIASGVRRIEAVTGREAARLSRQNKAAVESIGRILNVPSDGVVEAVQKTSATLSELQKENKKLKSERFSGGGRTAGESEEVGEIRFVHHDFGETDQETMAGWSDSFKANGGAIVAAGIGVIDGKRTFMATASQKALTGGIDVGKQFGKLVRELGGRGGGKPNFARGGLPEEISFDMFLSKVREAIKKVQL